jgi:hypothetical protein
MLGREVKKKPVNIAATLMDRLYSHMSTRESHTEYPLYKAHIVGSVAQAVYQKNSLKVLRNAEWAHGQ